MVGERLQQIRRLVPEHPTQERLASRTGGAVSRSSIANIEKGRQGLSLFQLYALAEALEVEVTELLPPKDRVIEDFMEPLDEGLEKHEYTVEEEKFLRRAFQSTDESDGGQT